ncbi:MAG: cytidine deaminase [Phascolarctobacterium sp.]|nr:cytidine deaminase [Phascolarctobacterium sp.]MBQ7760262.1 cytidine deaminase [Acidaminococcaceae bacterium]
MDKELLEAALAARERAYAPYSKFLVGAAVRAISGRIYTGCNIENASYGLTICAERSALFSAVGAGERKFTALCVVGDTEAPISPCGACRQVMAEFKVPKIILANLKGDVKEYTLDELLPLSFDL